MSRWWFIFSRDVLIIFTVVMFFFFYIQCFITRRLSCQGIQKLRGCSRLKVNKVIFFKKVISLTERFDFQSCFNFKASWAGSAIIMEDDKQRKKKKILKLNFFIFIFIFILAMLIVNAMNRALLAWKFNACNLIYYSINQHISNITLSWQTDHGLCSVEIFLLFPRSQDFSFLHYIYFFTSRVLIIRASRNWSIRDAIV